MSNLIPITRIYDIYPKYTYSNDVKKFMDEIVDIDRANVFTEADMVDILDKIRAEIEELSTNTRINWDGCCPDIDYPEIEYIDVTKEKLLQIIDKYKAGRSGKE